MSAPVPAAASRNSPCPCGSGRRYKECHGAPGHGGPSPASAGDAKAAALAAQRAGRLDDAAALYARALAVDPSDFDALHMLGVTRLMQHRFDEAVEFISRALAVRPGVAAALRNLEIARAPKGRPPSDGYDDWRATRERARDAAREERRRAIASRSGAPGIAVVVPVYETPAPLLRACLDSVLAQGYPRWELCVADDASRSPHVGDILREYAARDARVRVAFRERNGHISAATNSALALATMPHIALLDHDDVLAPCALAEVALALEARPDTEMLYSDEDKIDEAGRRFGAYFKPAWNPALLRSQNVVSHLGVYRRALVLAVGGFRAGYEGAQDWDLALRCSERIDERAIRHLPQVLYHWRTTEGSTARGHTQKSYAASAQERAVGEHWARRGVDVAVARVADGHHLRADPRLAPSVSLVVLAPAPAAGEAAASAWRAALPERLADVEVVTIGAGAVPSGIVDRHPPMLARGAAARINDAASRGRGETIVFVRADVVAPATASVETLAAHAALPDSGPVGGLLLDAFGMPVGGAWFLDVEGVADAGLLPMREATNSLSVREEVAQNVSAVRGDAMAIRRALWDALGGYDADALGRRFHDVDLCLRARREGCRSLWHPSAVFRLEAVLGESGPAAGADADAEAMRARHGEALADDPAYHPELDRPPRRFAYRLDDEPSAGDAR